jgi:hypothetical protein
VFVESRRLCSAVTTWSVCMQAVKVNSLGKVRPECV